MTGSSLKCYLNRAPDAACTVYGNNEWIHCRAKGKSKNAFRIKTTVEAVALETDGDFRFPPESEKSVCDWSVFTTKTFRGSYIELKGSDFNHAVEQLTSTIQYMKKEYNIVPVQAFIVISGSHLRNIQPSKANAKLKFAKTFPGVTLNERTFGNTNSSDVIQ
ncbi:MAG: hypothetical protein RR982_05915 [Kiritimatiellia bacterium]